MLPKSQNGNITYDKAIYKELIIQIFKLYDASDELATSLISKHLSTLTEDQRIILNKCEEKVDIIQSKICGLLFLRKKRSIIDKTLEDGIKEILSSYAAESQDIDSSGVAAQPATLPVATQSPNQATTAQIGMFGSSNPAPAPVSATSSANASDSKDPQPFQPN